MDTEKIEVLIKAIELGSLSKAANEFLYTPSALSHILESIENEIGIKFIKRSYSGISIESGCEEIVSNLKKIVYLKNRNKKIVSDIKLKKKTLTIATYASLSKSIVAKIIKAFNKTVSDIHINVIVSDDIKEVFENGGADIIFGEKAEGKSLCWEELITDPYVAVFPKSFGLKENNISIDELYNYSFVKAKDSRIASYIDERKMKNIISIDSHDDSSVICMVKEELGITVLPMLSVAEEKGVKWIKLEPSFERCLGLVYRENDYKEKAELKNFVEYIKSYCTDINKMEE